MRTRGRVIAGALTAVAALTAVTITACGGTTGGEAVAGDAVATTTAEPTEPEPTTGAEPTSGSRPTTTTDEPEPADELVLGPTGWGPIELGMPPEAAAATGVFADTPTGGEGECLTWTAVNAAPIETVVMSPRLGVAAIIPRNTAPISTPEGIAFGSSAADVAAAYPDFTVDDVDTPNGARVAVPGADTAVFRMSFTDAAQVSYLTLELLNQDCYG